jgi:hypothetical protein
MRLSKLTQELALALEVASIQQMREFLFEIEEMIANQSNDFEAIGRFVNGQFHARCGRHFQRILFGYDTLIENACDPALDYLEWKSEIKEALTVAKNSR